MTIPPVPNRTLWEDRFRRPQAAELLDALPKHMIPVATHAREALSGTPGITEKLLWHGVWKWTFTFSQAMESGRAWVYLVPDPSRLRICIPFEADLIQQLPLRKLPKYLRDGLIHAPQVGPTKWPTWELQGKGQFEDCLAFAVGRLKPAAE